MTSSWIFVLQIQTAVTVSTMTPALRVAAPRSWAAGRRASTSSPTRYVASDFVLHVLYIAVPDARRLDVSDDVLQFSASQCALHVSRSVHILVRLGACRRCLITCLFCSVFVTGISDQQPRLSLLRRRPHHPQRCALRCPLHHRRVSMRRGMYMIARSPSISA